MQKNGSWNIAPLILLIATSIYCHIVFAIMFLIIVMVTVMAFYGFFVIIVVLIIAILNVNTISICNTRYTSTKTQTRF